MNASLEPNKHVLVIGGGISGLACAYFLQESARSAGQPLRISLLESQSCLGGKIITEQVDGFTIEGGPDSVIRQKPWAQQLAQKLGLGSEIIGTNDERRKTFVVNRGRLTPLPDGVMLIIPTRIWPFVTSPLISWGGKIRMGMDLFIPPRQDDDDESLAHFIRRRLGEEALEKIAEPLMSGIHVSDPEEQSLLGTFPRFRNIEKQYGSLTRGMLAQKKAAKASGAAQPPAKSSGPTSAFISLKRGMQSLVGALEQTLVDVEIHTDCPVESITHLEDGRYRVTAGAGSPAIEADAIILAAPAFVSAKLVADFAPQLASLLKSIRYVSTATISLAFRGSDFGREPQGFGFVIPKKEKRNITACTWTSTKFNHRAPQADVLLRCFVGGPSREDIVEKSDEELARTARAELKGLMGVIAEPLFTRVYRWRQANPQYDVGHLGRVSQMHALCRETPGLYLTGGAYEGVGVPDCIHQGEQAAKKALEYLFESQPEPALP